MKVKDYLMQYQDSRKRIRHLEEEILEVRHAMASVSKPIGSGSYSSNPVTTSPQEKLIYKLIELEELGQVELVHCFSIMFELSRQIHQLGGSYRDLLYCRYVKGMDIKQIAEEMAYSYDHTKRLHGEALKAFDQKYKIYEIEQDEEESWKT